jgi:serine/threonine protein kinase
MEYLEMGDLSTYLGRRPALPEAEVQEITYQILDGLNMMHDNNFAHRDLKPSVSLPFLDSNTHNLTLVLQNILIQSRPPHAWWVKISDFGISKHVEEASAPSTDLIGTFGYMAPELYGVIGRGTPFASDIWALGQIVFELLTKELAFKHLGSLVKYVRTEQFPTGLLSKSSALSVEFITSLACPIPRDRMTAAVAFTHAWIESKPSPSNSGTNISPYTSETNVSPYTEDLSTTDSMSEVYGSWNTKPPSPVPDIVGDGEKH